MEINVKKVKGLYCMVMTLALFVIFYLYNTNHFWKTSDNLLHKFPVQTFTNGLPYKKPGFNMKYILLWTSHEKSPFVYFSEGTTMFINRQCKFTNCYVTSNRNMLGHYSEFEVVAFNGPQLMEVIDNDDIPKIRSVHQKYVYANIEAAMNYPICGQTWDNFFNWTWTYKLNSDAVWGYFSIWNLSHVIGPSMNINWINENNMAPIDDDVISKLTTKNKAAAWFVSNCKTQSGREHYFNDLQNFMDEYNLKVDVYGDCGDFQCPKIIMNRCLKELQSYYYFYLAFENAVCEDYITEKILHALNHYTVPITYGGANYSRFLPPGSYLDAEELGPKALAAKIYEIINNPESYYNFFKWRKYYSYKFRHEFPETDDYCKFCAMVNDETLMNKSSVYSNFSAWWTPATSSIC